VDLAERGGLLRRDYAPKHGTGLADALIAASAQQCGAELVTLNAKHFPMLQNVIVPCRKQVRKALSASYRSGFTRRPTAAAKLGRASRDTQTGVRPQTQLRAERALVPRLSTFSS
jgi:hypothetical protein